MFGHPLFAFSGANPGVVDRLGATDWKTGVGPGEVGAGRTSATSPGRSRTTCSPSTDVLRTRPAPLAFPAPRCSASVRPGPAVAGSRSRA